jgi:hypothetical protein
MFPDADFDPHRPEPPHTQILIDDLGLETVLTTMADGDRLCYTAARSALLAPLTDPAQILYRQQALADVLAHEPVVRELYDLAAAALEDRKKSFFGFWHGSPTSILSSSVTILSLLKTRLRQLRAIADQHAAHFTSPGFTAFFHTVAVELDDTYLDEIDAHLQQLRLRHGVHFSARLGRGNKSIDFVVRTAHLRHGIKGLILGAEPGPAYSVTVPDRDEAGAQEVADLEGRALNPVAEAVAQSADHVASFFTQLRTELAFHLAGANLHHALTAHQAPVCFPEPAPPGEQALTVRDLYEITLPLRGTEHVVGNDLDADAKPLIVITGANQGGKSTLARATALAGVTAAAGLHAPATAMRFSPAGALFTHYRRAEDATMSHGKFEEELARMREIVEHATPGALLVMNESFAATNEREGADVATPIIHALLDAGLRVLLVTHSYELAEQLRREDGERALFLRAQRLSGGQRTFHLIPAPPQSTSYGQDLYQEVFAEDLDADRPVTTP